MSILPAEKTQEIFRFDHAIIWSADVNNIVVLYLVVVEIPENIAVLPLCAEPL